MTRHRRRRRTSEVEMKKVGQIMLFPRTRPSATLPLPIKEVLLIGVRSEQDQTRIPHDLVRVGHGLGIRYLAEWELRAAEIEPLAWVPVARATRSDREPIAVTIDEELIEQDRSGVLYGAGGRAIGEGALISYSSTPSGEERCLSLGERAAWLIGGVDGETFTLSARLSEPLLWVYAPPTALGPVGAFGGWITAATSLARKESCRAHVEETGEPGWASRLVRGNAEADGEAE